MPDILFPVTSRICREAEEKENNKKKDPVFRSENKRFPERFSGAADPHMYSHGSLAGESSLPRELSRMKDFGRALRGKLPPAVSMPASVF
ncbi:hypothetical protein CEXT_307351 [Caerostris extrusa]|uniref:Uncharacterized protein n=1 Tax=Caerostris extrusa TaxID=172846 RepID=A0AAV4UUJ0_CAEEX|nr:hypothetical protein CEXT_307351 [Caerostris extrusa]